jgi:hypothetical protein
MTVLNSFMMIMYLNNSISQCLRNWPVSWDTTISKVTVPRALLCDEECPEYIEDAIPSNPEVIETICYTRLLEEFMIDALNKEHTYESEVLGKASAIYFSDLNGVFRMTPAKYQSKCWDYDPRTRPFFIGSISGPKDVVLVLDTSKNMAYGNRFDDAKAAVETIIRTLTVADRVAVITFNSTADVINTTIVDELIVASNENKEELIEGIKSLEAIGTESNFTSAFGSTFNVLKDSINILSTAGRGCNIAIILLSAGALPEGMDDSEEEHETAKLTKFVKDGVTEIGEKYERNVTIFAYSLGDESGAKVMKNITCATDGIFTQISGGDRDNLISKMMAYYQLYASGLDGNNNESSAVWVEPYVFRSDGKLGTTVSVPVYDANGKQVGVVGVDTYMDTLQKILKVNETEAIKWMNDWIVKLDSGSRKCPQIKPDICRLEALRSLGGNQSKCGGNGTCDHLLRTNCPTPEIIPHLWTTNTYRKS